MEKTKARVEITTGTPPAKPAEGVGIVEIACEELVRRGYSLYKGDEDITEKYRAKIKQTNE